MSDLPEQQSFRHYSAADIFITNVDRALNNIFCEQNSQRPFPADTVNEETPLTPEDSQQSAAMMRVNHAGEMAAQALYHGQSLIARDPSLKDKLHHASLEESDHLNWCRRRLQELGEQPSRLDPFWYAGSFAIGITAGIAGDRWNLGFLAETEHQVVRHLDGHLQRLPAHDTRSRAIIEQMRIDEQGHAELAEHLGAAKLPESINKVMGLLSKVMTNIASKI